MNLLEDKGIMTQDEQLELNKNALKAMQKKLDEAAKKYPSIAEGLKQSSKQARRLAARCCWSRPERAKESEELCT
ncbi:MAG: hypothetical protein ACXV2D_08910 [Halobacteriota archaeon]